MRDTELAIIISSQTSASGIIVVIKNNQEILLDLTDFALQKQPEDNLMVAVSRARAWYNGSYTVTLVPRASLLPVQRRDPGNEVDIPSPATQSNPWNHIIQLSKF